MVGRLSDLKKLQRWIRNWEKFHGICILFFILLEENSYKKFSSISFSVLKFGLYYKIKRFQIIRLDYLLYIVRIFAPMPNLTECGWINVGFTKSNFCFGLHKNIVWCQTNWNIDSSIQLSDKYVYVVEAMKLMGFFNCCVLTALQIVQLQYLWVSIINIRTVHILCT